MALVKPTKIVILSVLLVVLSVSLYSLWLEHIKERRRERAALPCPDEPVIARLHDAVFHLDQRDDDARVRKDLLEVAALMQSDPAGATWAGVVVNRIRAGLDYPDHRQFEAESIRADLHASACLTKALHERLHQSLR
jgi:hypothetical protein